MRYPTIIRAMEMVAHEGNIRLEDIERDLAALPTSDLDEFCIGDGAESDAIAAMTPALFRFNAVLNTLFDGPALSSPAPGERDGMTAFPSQVWILGQRYAITRGHGWLMGCKDETDGRDGFLEGFCQRQDCTIGIAPTLGDGEYARESLLHEIIHGLDDGMIPGMAARAQTVRKPRRLRRADKRKLHRPVFLREETVHAWSRGLYATVRDPRNRAVFRYIFEYEIDYPLFRASADEAPAPKREGGR